MTDEDILKPLAEIEGVQVFVWESGRRTKGGGGKGMPYAGQWNPLTNWSDLGPLIEKYKVCCWYEQADGLWSCWRYTENGDLPALCDKSLWLRSLSVEQHSRTHWHSSARIVLQ